MGGAAKSIGNVVGTGLTLGLNKIGGPDNPLRRFGNFAGSVVTGGQSGQGFGATRTDASGNPIGSGVSGSGTSTDPFTLDPNQLAADQAAITGLGATQAGQITGLGQQQYGDTSSFIGQDAASRAAARDQLAGVLTNQAKSSFGQMLPNIAENSQAAHLYDSTGYGQEVARQQAALESGITSQLGQVGVQDIYNQSAQKQAAEQALRGTQTSGLGVQQGFGQASLGRQLSLEDFINSANISKQIGAQTAPQVGNGKGATGSLLSGIGSLAPLAGTLMGGPAGGMAGVGVQQATSGKGSGGGVTGSPQTSLFGNTQGYGRYA